MIERILQRTSEWIYNETAQRIQSEIVNMQRAFAAKAENSSLLVEYEKQLEDYRNLKTKDMFGSYLDMVEWLMELHKNPHIEFNEDCIKLMLSAFNQTNKIAQHIESQDLSLKSQREEIERKLALEIKAFDEEIKDVKQQVEKFKDNHAKKKEEEYNRQIDKINKSLASLAQQLEHINSQETDLEHQLTECPDIKKCKTAIKPFQDLWELIRDWNKAKVNWETCQITTLVPDEVDKEHKRMLMLSRRLQVQFETLKYSKVSKLTEETKIHIESFKENLPVIRALCTEGLQRRHYEQIEKLLEMGTIQGDENLSNFITFGVVKHKDKIEEITDTASKEWGNRKILDTMKADWEPLEFTPSA